MRCACALAALLFFGCGEGALGGTGPDAAPPDAKTPDASAPDAMAMPDSGSDDGPPRLSDQGLYADIATKTLAADVVEYAPTYPLWADGADKRRWIKLPPGTRIDTSDMDHWVFPPGTKFFKQFSLNGTLLETRLIMPGGTMEAFVWAADGSDAYLMPDGAQDVLGTDHDVPSTVQCHLCHDGEPGSILGFSALQLSRTGAGVTLSALAGQGLLTSPPPAGVTYPPPGTGTTADALGYLHANCGQCHNPLGGAFQRGVHMVLRTYVAETDPMRTMMWATTMRQPLEAYQNPSFQYIIVPGSSAMSTLPYLMNLRGSIFQMPPVATEHPDMAAVMLVSQWIDSLPP